MDSKYIGVKFEQFNGAFLRTLKANRGSTSKELYKQDLFKFH